MFKSNKKRRKEILERQPNIKAEDFDFERIALFFSHEDHPNNHQIVDERTLEDLDFEALFIALDRTSSSVGQQFLYSKLRVIPKDLQRTQQYDHHVRNLSSDQKEDAIITLSTLNSTGAYFIQRLFFGDQITKPGWFWVIPTLSLSLILALLFSAFYSQAILFALLLVGINTLIHLWNKNNVLGYSNSIPQLLRLHKVASTLHENVYSLVPMKKSDSPFSN